MRYYSAIVAKFLYTEVDNFTTAPSFNKLHSQSTELGNFHTILYN